jgi:hypothetical protein
MPVVRGSRGHVMLVREHTCCSVWSVCIEMRDDINFMKADGPSEASIGARAPAVATRCCADLIN